MRSRYPTLCSVCVCVNSQTKNREADTKGRSMRETVLGTTFLILWIASHSVEAFFVTTSYVATAPRCCRRRGIIASLPPRRSEREASTGTPQDEDEEDGWGFDLDDKVIAEFLEKEAGELTDNNANVNTAIVGKERDLFIPIFALISLGGLVGAYGYEMLRLFLRGELYLPYIH